MAPFTYLYGGCKRRLTQALNVIDTGRALDTFDIAILALLQNEGSLKSESIAERIGLSPSAVQRRIRRLKAIGVIERIIAVIDPKAVGIGLSFIVEVTMERERLELFDSFKREAGRHPEIQQIYYVTGESDFILFVNAASMQAYDELARRLFFENSNVKRFRTILVLNRIKASLGVPLGGS